MSWFRLDDQGAFHAKVLAAGNEAYGAWCRAGQWSSGHRTEGRIPRATALTIARQRVWERLIEAGLMESLGDNGWQIHDYLDWNPSAAEVDGRRDRVSKARSEAGRIGGLRSGETRRKSDAPSSNGEAKTEASGEAKPEANHSSKPQQNEAPSPSPSPSPKKEDPPIGPQGGDGLLFGSDLTPPRTDRVAEIFEHYSATRKRHRPTSRAVQLKPKEKARTLALLKAGYSVEDLKLACEGLFRSPHHTGSNDRDGAEYLAFFHAMSERAVDGLIELGRAAERRTGPLAAAAYIAPEQAVGEPPSPEEVASFQRTMEELHSMGGGSILDEIRRETAESGVHATGEEDDGGIESAG